MRLDKFIFEHFNLKSRQYAQTLIKENCVFVNGNVINKPSVDVCGSENIEINDYLKYVGRGGLKLEKALSVFSIDVSGMTAMDIGASTGGFTDCLLQNGTSKVYAVDVGHDQLAEKLKNDSRVVNLENTNIKDLSPSDFDSIDIVVVDVSFISLEKIAANIALFDPKILVCLIKPQFENAKTNKNGIVKDKSQYKNVIMSVTESFSMVGLNLNGLSVSPIKGGDGNIEFISYFTKEKPKTPLSELIRSVIDKDKLKV
ncbi:MAG: TlyA family RNA methyltransferase [Clostridia bacterium]|nr:TlyA family RNA methyltransferase [Clostridia bacterium]